MAIEKTKLTTHDLLLAKHLQKLRKEKRLTQEQLAERIDVSTTWLGYIEMGKFRPNLRLLYKIAKELDIKVKDLFPF